MQHFIMEICTCEYNTKIKCLIQTVGLEKLWEDFLDDLIWILNDE
jgi:hypothetical protein